MKHSMHPAAIAPEPPHLSGQQERFGEREGPAHMEDPRDRRKYGEALRPTGTPRAEADAIARSRIEGETDVREPGLLDALHMMAHVLKSMDERAEIGMPWRVTVTAAGLLVMNRPKILLQTIVNNSGTTVTIGLGDDMPGNSAQNVVTISIPGNSAFSFNAGIPFPQRLSANVLTGTAPFNVLLAGTTY